MDFVIFFSFFLQQHPRRYAWLCKVVIHLENASSNQCSSGECEAHAGRRTISNLLFHVSVCVCAECSTACNVCNEKVRTSNVGNTLWTIQRERNTANGTKNQRWSFIRMTREKMEKKRNKLMIFYDARCDISRISFVEQCNNVTAIVKNTNKTNFGTVFAFCSVWIFSLQLRWCCSCYL